MKLIFIRHIHQIAYASILLLSAALSARAVDIEAFEFNDPATTVLANAANTGTGGIGVWVEDAGMASSDIRGGVYNIVKASSLLESNFFQINNITTGTYYLTTRLDNWRFGDAFDTANREEYRLGFVNDDDANFGTTITAQVAIRRNASGGVELFADALGAGATTITNIAPLPNVQTQPFMAVIELNKTSNTYKVFYKDGANPTQVLGMGAVSPDRAGNSVRMAANNNWGEFNIDYPSEPPYEVMAVDRIALSNTNPFNDLITLEIDRTSGLMTLRNTSGAALSGLESYSITSASGSFDPVKWKTVAGNYDSTGNGSVDNAPWAVTDSTKTELAETFTSGNGGGLTINQNVVLSVPTNGTWIKSPFEDVHMTLNLTGGAARTVNVNFVGNGGLKWATGDLDFDNAIDSDDWLTFIANAETDISAFSRAERYQRGDLNSDGFNNIADFILFKGLYDAANGSGSFSEMLTSLVPEPSGFTMLACAAGAFLARRRARRRPELRMVSVTPSIEHTHQRTSTTGELTMPQVAKVLFTVCVTAAVTLCASSSRAVVLEDFPFSDANGSLLEEADNAANSGNNWVVATTGTGELTNSSVLNGSFRIQKTTTNLSSNYLDIANVTSGKVWLVVEFAGWNFSATASSPSEEIRFAFLDNDNSPPSGSTITAQMDIARSGTGLAVFGRGALGTGATNVGSSYGGLSLVRATPFAMALELDKVLDQYSVYYKDNTADFQLLGTANLGASTLNMGDRDGNSIRFGITGAYNDINEFVDINRIYLTNTSPIGGVVEPVALTLQVFSDGQVSIFNDTDNPISFNSYRIGSTSNDLHFAGWNSLSDQNLNAVDGPDLGTTTGNSPGETWDEAGGSDNGVLREDFLLGSTTIAPTDSISLGSAFQIGGDQTLTFEYLDFNTGAIVVGAIEYLVSAGVDGDYNNDGFVNAADYVMWRKLNGTNADLPNDPNPVPIDGDQYNTWKRNFGSSNAGAGSSASNVPEPGGMWAALIFAAILLGTTRRVVGLESSRKLRA